MENKNEKYQINIEILELSGKKYDNKILWLNTFGLRNFMKIINIFQNEFFEIYDYNEENDFKKIMKKIRDVFESDLNKGKDIREIISTHIDKLENFHFDRYNIDQIMEIFIETRKARINTWQSILDSL